MTREIILYLSDIIENMQDAEQFVAGKTYEQFRANKMAINAVLRSLEVIGEAVKQIPQDIQSRRPSVPWRSMARMRDRVIHMYFGIDYQRVWEAVTEAIPPVRPQIQSLLDDLRKEQTK